MTRGGRRNATEHQLCLAHHSRPSRLVEFLNREVEGLRRAVLIGLLERSDIRRRLAPPNRAMDIKHVGVGSCRDNYRHPLRKHPRHWPPIKPLQRLATPLSLRSPLSETLLLGPAISVSSAAEGGNQPPLSIGRMWTMYTPCSISMAYLSRQARASRITPTPTGQDC